jgi:hypothetical protein
MHLSWLVGGRNTEGCDEFGSRTTQYYNWQKQLFENAEGAFARRPGSRPKEHLFRAHGEPGDPSLMFQYTLRLAASSWSLIPLDFASQPNASPLRFSTLLISRQFTLFSCHFSPFATHSSVIAIL